ncbi:MAG: helix-turn-helix domain-containing protein [Acidobacteriota bacterium]|nr:helix-turn-helix domain-containing protein [Acidobacteriota bacterium]
MDQRIRIVISRMQGDLRRTLTLDEMAATANLSRSHFCRLFKTETGGSPAKYFKWLRVQKAKELLETTLFSVKEIKAMVGLHDESHFVRDFEMACGLTPARYRANHNGDPLRKKNRGGGGKKKAKSANE